MAPVLLIVPSRLLKKAHLRRWRPRPHAQRTGSTPRVRPSGAALHLDLFEQPASFSASSLETRREASPPFRSLPPGIVAPAKPALEPGSPRTSFFSDTLLARRLAWFMNYSC